MSECRCISSKALLHTTLVIDEAEELAAHGISFGKLRIDFGELRDFKSGVVKKLTGGLAGMAKARKVEVVTGVGTFVDPHHMDVQGDGGKKVVRFKQAIITGWATRYLSFHKEVTRTAGSQAVNLPLIAEDPRVVDSTCALELRQIPKRMLVIGGGIIGRAQIDVVEMLDGLMLGADRDL